MKTTITVLMICVTMLANGQGCDVPDAIQSAKKMKVSVFQDPEGENNNNYIIAFKVPEKSDEVLESSELDCEGWMPKGATIEKIVIKDVEEIPWGSIWTCDQNKCSWSGGSTGCVNLQVSETIENDLEVYVEIEGLGNWHGISRWYECKLELTIPAP